MRKKLGMILIVSVLLTWVAEKSTLNISKALGMLYCGDDYMQAVEGIVGDKSCGFNADMYLASVLLVILLIGFIMHITATRNQ